MSDYSQHHNIDGIFQFRVESKWKKSKAQPFRTLGSYNVRRRGQMKMLSLFTACFDSFFRLIRIESIAFRAVHLPSIGLSPHIVYYKYDYDFVMCTANET